MNDEMIYMERLIKAYEDHGRICPALKECMDVIPYGDLLIRVKNAYTGLMRCEYEVREALLQIETDDVLMHIIHDALSLMEAKRKVKKGVLDQLHKVLFLRQNIRPFKKQKHSKRIAIKYAKMYESLRKMKSGHKKRKTRLIITEHIMGELIDWMVGFGIYLQLTDEYTAIKMSVSLTHGFLKSQVLSLKRDMMAQNEVCGFLSDLEIPELNGFLLDCKKGPGMVLNIESIRELSKRSSIEIKKQKRKVKFGFAAVFAVVIITGYMVADMEIRENERETRLKKALSSAMLTTVSESGNIKIRNQMLAVFMQKMIQQVDDDIDLTVRVCEMDEKDKEIEVEAIGEYDSLGGRRSVAVRRRLRFG